jgi:energy-coupling factor transporter ATP-binding protein EcfA2
VPKYAVTPTAPGTPQSAVSFGSDAGQTDRVLFGRLNEQGPLRQVSMDISAESVVAIFGKRGSGKSYTLGVLAEALAAPGATAIGQSSGRKSALLLDTLNVFWSLANPIASHDDELRFPEEAVALRAWSIQAPALNVDVWIPNGFRQTHTPIAYGDLTVAPADVSIDDLLDLLELDANADPMGQLIAEAVEAAAGQTPRFVFDDVLSVLDNQPAITGFYADGTVRGARQRVRSLARLPLFASPNGTPLRELVSPGRLGVIELGEVPASLRSVIASVLLRRIHQERARASDAEKQVALNTRLSSGEVAKLKSFVEAAIPPAWVLIDEAQNVLPSDRQIKSSDAVLRFVREGRNFGLSFALTTQQPSAVDQRILAQADTIICHKLTVAQDIARMRDNLKSAEPTEVRLGGQKLDLSAWLRSLDPGVALVTNTEFERVFALQVRPRVTPHGGTGFRATQE